MSKCLKCGQELKKPVKLSKDGWVWIQELQIYVEKDVHHKNHSYDELKEIYGKDFEKMLLTKSQVEVLDANENYRKMFKMRTLTNDFYIQQYNQEHKKLGYVAEFYSYWDWSVFGSVRGSGDSDDVRGVRFCRKKI